MHLRRLPVITLLVGIPSIAHAQATTTSQAWLSAQGEAELTRTLDLGVEQQLRSDGDDGFDQTFTELATKLEVKDALRVGGFYRYAVLEDDERRHRVGANAEARAGLGRLELRYRLRLQHTTREDDEGRDVVRNRVKLVVDAPHKLEPFVSGEVFYLLGKSEVREQRAGAGVDWDVARRLTVSAFYLYQHEVNVEMPEHHHVLGVGVGWQIRDAKKPKKKKTRKLD